MLVLPSDHAIGDEEAFFEGVKYAAALAEQGPLVTFGIAPTGPETGFGYIEQGEALGAEGYRVARFVEKPDADAAAAMLARGGYSWNSGMFLLRASVYLKELERFAPQIYTACKAARTGRKDDQAFSRPASEAFLASPSDSIDYAVMEHTDLAAVVPLGVSWSDLGSWEAFYQNGQQDDCGNVCSGDVMPEVAEDCYFNANHRLLTAIGMSGLVVVETQDAVLVAPRDRCRTLKRLWAACRTTIGPNAGSIRLCTAPGAAMKPLSWTGGFRSSASSLIPAPSFPCRCTTTARNTGSW